MDTKTAAEIAAEPEYRTDEEIRTAYHVLCKSKAAFADSAADKLEQFAERRGIELDASLVSSVANSILSV